MTPENNENSDERVLTLEEILELYFREEFDRLTGTLEINISPDDIACFCREHSIGHPKHFTMHLFEVISETITRQHKHPNVRYFQAPKWLDVKGKEICLRTDSLEDLKNKLPNLERYEEATSDYKRLARVFLSSLEA